MSSVDRHSGKDHSPLFDLPRELRDQVYESIPPETRYLIQPRRPFHDVDIAIRGGLSMNLLLVSKQFKYEYKQRHQSRGVLVVDAINVRWRPAFNNLPQPMRNAPALGTMFRALDTFDKSKIYSPGESVQAALDCLPMIKIVSVKILCTRGRKPEPPKSMAETWRSSAWERRILDGLLAIEEVNSIHIFSAKTPYDGNWVDEAGHRGLRLIGH